MTRSLSIKAPLLVSPIALQELRSSTSADVKILDASWFMPNVPRNPSKEFVEKHIPGARYLDLDEVATPSELGLKHMMPSSEVFSEALGTFSREQGTLSKTDIILEIFGITPTSHVVL
jgi:thiosulfate/3-mercaptopyruvate sulfurtransferase